MLLDVVLAVGLPLFDAVDVAEALTVPDDRGETVSDAVPLPEGPEDDMDTRTVWVSVASSDRDAVARTLQLGVVLPLRLEEKDDVDDTELLELLDVDSRMLTLSEYEAEELGDDVGLPLALGDPATVTLSLLRSEDVALTLPVALMDGPAERVSVGRTTADTVVESDGLGDGEYVVLTEGEGVSEGVLASLKVIVGVPDVVFDERRPSSGTTLHNTNAHTTAT